MNARDKKLSVVAAPAADALASGPWFTAAWTMEERLHRIECLGRKIGAYVEFMCHVADLDGVSAEAKERAVAAFYDRMVLVEQQLGRIQESFRLQ